MLELCPVAGGSWGFFYSVNDTANWLLGRLTRSTVAATVGTASPNTPVGVFQVDLTISTNTPNYNLKVAAIAAGWDQIIPLIATVTVNSGVYVYATSTGNAAFDTGSGYPGGSTITLLNNGYIMGMGGAGGSMGVNGQAGGNAINAMLPMIIASSSGYIMGGGGGGGGGGFSYNFLYPCKYQYPTGDGFGGGGGGGGAGYNPSSGAAGGIPPSGVDKRNGYAGAPGTAGGGGAGGAGGCFGCSGVKSGGSGGNGGGFGAPGATGGVGYSYNGCTGVTGSISTVGSGGAGGKAVNPNGNAITWISGFPTGHVYGATN